MRCYFDCRGLHCELMAGIISYPTTTTRGSISFLSSNSSELFSLEVFSQMVTNLPRETQEAFMAFQRGSGCYLYVYITMLENGR